MDLEKFELVQHGVIYPFTIQSFKEIMKIEDGGEDINFEDYVDIDNKVRNEVCNLEKSIKCTDLVELITNSEEADVLFVARFMLVALGSFLVPTSGTYVRKEYINALLDVGRIKKLNWASFIFKFLHENLKAHQKRLNNSKDKGKVHYLPGCTIYLQIYYWSHIKRKLYTSPRLGLPMAYWNEDRVKGISSFISKSGGFVNGKVHFWFTTLQSYLLLGIGQYNFVNCYFFFCKVILKFFSFWDRLFYTRLCSGRHMAIQKILPFHYPTREEPHPLHAATAS
ncbi:uncharacterized protein LOC115703895 [Cannabis sativa]|uniref:uncharacterized protein LOC115703895 n=1 Tax=Cannabis sativa TaxID=3483 RepID=UPI0029C9B4E9|nr:uncharacterized protein LOC115703895 [Cannabis sativa]